MLSKKFIIILLVVVLVPLLVLLGFLGYLVYSDSKMNPDSVMVTNVTDTGASIVWRTGEKTEGKLVAREKGKSGWNLGPFHDDRDMEQNDEGEYELKEAGAQERYTHHVTVRSLEPEKEYEYAFVGNIKKVQAYESGTTFEVIKTKAINENLKTPDPGYGQIENIEADDSVIILTDAFADESNFVRASSFLSSNSTYSIDLQVFESEDFSASNVNFIIMSGKDTLVGDRFENDGYKPFETLTIKEQEEGDGIESIIINKAYALMNECETGCSADNECSTGLCQPCNLLDSTLSGSFCVGSSVTGIGACLEAKCPDSPPTSSDSQSSSSDSSSAGSDKDGTGGQKDCDTSLSGLCAAGCHSGDREPEDGVVICNGGGYCASTGCNEGRGATPGYCAGIGWGSSHLSFSEYCATGNDSGSSDSSSDFVIPSFQGTQESAAMGDPFIGGKNAAQDASSVSNLVAKKYGNEETAAEVAINTNPSMAPSENECKYICPNGGVVTSAVGGNVVCYSDVYSVFGLDEQNRIYDYPTCLLEEKSGPTLSTEHCVHICNYTGVTYPRIGGKVTCIGGDGQDLVYEVIGFSDKESTAYAGYSECELKRLYDQSSRVAQDIKGSFLSTVVAQGNQGLEADESGVYSVVSDKFEEPIGEFAVNLDGEDKIRIQLFVDRNGNGIKDPDEFVLDKYIDISLRKESDVAIYDLQVGWNMIALPIFSSQEIDTASELIQHFNDQGASVVHLAKYTDAGFIMYTKREDDLTQEFNDDFHLVPGEGYFVLNYTAMRVRLEGNKFDEAVPFRVRNGWNLVGVYTNEQTYSAEELLKDMSAQGIVADTVTKYDSGLYKNVVYVEDLLYGNDFDLYEREGYFLRVESGGGEDIRFTPSPD